jgi:glycyl-tRNA synthetase beta subunit
MPTLNLVTELTVNDLLDVIAELDDDELAEFEARFEQLWTSRFSSLDQEAAQIANLKRLSPKQQARLRALLEKNREEGLKEDEEAELDSYIAKIDRSLETIGRATSAIHLKR